MFQTDISEIHPAQEAFRSGTLEMTSPEGADIISSAGNLTAGPAASVMMLLLVILIVATMSDFIKMLPLLARSFTRKSAALSIEHNVTISRERNITAFAFAMPFCLLAAQFDLYSPSFFETFVPGQLTAPAILAVLFLYLLLRHIIFKILPSVRHMTFDSSRALKRGLFSYFILIVPLTSATIGAMLVFGADRVFIREVCLWEIAAIYALSLLRSANILSDFCSAFGTFLYLCALELIPAGALVASAIFL